MKIATRDDWNIREMPEKRDTFTLEREFTEEQIAALRRGNIPREMEDKWFWFMEGDRSSIDCWIGGRRQTMIPMESG